MNEDTSPLGMKLKNTPWQEEKISLLGPYKCPVCNGTGNNPASYNTWFYGIGTRPYTSWCPACHGACVLWRP